MGQEPDEIRGRIEQTRNEMGETIDALGYKADVPARAKDKVARYGRAGARVGRRHRRLHQGRGNRQRRIAEGCDTGSRRGRSQGSHRRGRRAVEPIGTRYRLSSRWIPRRHDAAVHRVEDKRIGSISPTTSRRTRPDVGQEAIEHGKDVAKEGAARPPRRLGKAPASTAKNCATPPKHTSKPQRGIGPVRLATSAAPRRAAHTCGAAHASSPARAAASERRDVRDRDFGCGRGTSGLMSRNDSFPHTYDKKSCCWAYQSTACPRPSSRLQSGWRRKRGTVCGRSRRRGVAAIGRRILDAGGDADSADAGSRNSRRPSGRVGALIRLRAALARSSRCGCGTERSRSVLVDGRFRACAGGIRSARRGRAGVVPAVYRSRCPRAPSAAGRPPAPELQQLLLPPRIAGFRGAEIAASVLPAYDVGGDWFEHSAAHRGHGWRSPTRRARAAEHPPRLALTVAAPSRRATGNGRLPTPPSSWIRRSSASGAVDVRNGAPRTLGIRDPHTRVAHVRPPETMPPARRRSGRLEELRGTVRPPLGLLG